jgi:hypothetical protein
MSKNSAIEGQQQTNKAIDCGLLIRPNHCELCGRHAQDRLKPTTSKAGKSIIVAHHWNGYDNPLDVWFICPSCNGKLKGRHDGSLTREEARKFVFNYQPQRVPPEILLQNRKHHPNITEFRTSQTRILVSQNQTVYSTPYAWEIWEGHTKIKRLRGVKEVIGSEMTNGEDEKCKNRQGGVYSLPNSHFKTPGSKKTTKIAFNLHETNIQIIKALVAAGYAKNQTAVIQRALREAAARYGLDVTNKTNGKRSER